MIEKDLEKQIKEFVKKGLAGDMASVNSIKDRILRGKVKAAIVKAKRADVSKENEKSKSVEGSNTDDLIAKLVQEGLSGNMDSINSLEDRVLRAKAKSALIKAKKLAAVSSNDSLSNQNKDKKENSINLDFNNLNVKFGQMIDAKFPKSLSNNLNEDFIGLKPDNWLQIAKWLKSDPEILFDSLQCITGMDLGENLLESRYNLHSMKYGNLIEIRIEVSRDKPNIPSIEQIWRSGDWFERETYDMYGIIFEGHRDLRRMLLPEDWEGFPLRKDYQEQETYHGIIVKKIKEEAWE